MSELAGPLELLHGAHERVSCFQGKFRGLTDPRDGTRNGRSPPRRSGPGLYDPRRRGAYGFSVLIVCASRWCVTTSSLASARETERTGGGGITPTARSPVASPGSDLQRRYAAARPPTARPAPVDFGVTD
jgi:hypothetical protein